jgi:hypothetical protein
MMATGFRPIRRLVTATLAAAGVAAICGGVLSASDQSIALTRFQATIRTSTSLQVSNHMLVIAPRPGKDERPLAAGSIEFRAAARTASDGEVILTVEPLAPIASISGGGAGESATTIAFEGSGDGAQSGALVDARPETAARWVGSGLRTGRLTFTVRGPVSPSGAVLPLRFLLAAP